ncbi:XdhC family protein [Lacrimispora celerecrescens]|uniref:Xanthine dehydrogenase accessory factor n=1 Tax=[Clostridium] celerecrescens 18A TaxID=1286362 RepID=A0A2M8Z7I8_9FIRM|nr:XdhC/CoxI family protein [Lacrimispora celerecrescens]PJJ29401.1 xanthine dehydrogenase accessory factor [[Clostridium] celerecrescens 18A]
MTAGFYEELKNADKNTNLISLTIVEGKGLGGKALWSNGEIICRQGVENAFDAFSEDLKSIDKTQTIKAQDSTLYCEFVTGEKYMVVCGAGHISIPIIRIGRMLGFHVTVIDDRLSFANTARKEGADTVICKPFGEALQEIEGTAGHYFIIVTRGHRYDQDCLSQIIGKKNAYIGMIGSKVRVKLVKDFLADEGISRELLDQVFTPIGLKINAQTPEEIAVAIMAEIIQVKNGSKNSFGYPKEILDVLTSVELSDMPKSLVTIVSRKGSAPRDVGSKMVVMLDGSTIGTIGGGCVESEVCAAAREVARDKKPVLMKVDMTPGNAEDEGMVCGGMVEVYIEPVLS